MGLRESRKQQTRKSISDMATMLFLERGYHEVTTAEIAERAQVSVPTLFNYFPTKESLVFDEDSEMENNLINTVLNRKQGKTILDALFDAGVSHIDKMRGHEQLYKKFWELVDGTPELSRYAKQMWLRHEVSLAKAIRSESKSKISVLESEAIAHYILDSYHRAFREPHSKKALTTLFSVLQKGWDN